MSVDSSSWVNMSREVTVDGITFWKKSEVPEFEPDETDRIHIVSDGESLQDIAFVEYSDWKLWWAIALLNDIRRPCSDVGMGDQIRIPTENRIRAKLVEAKRQR